MPPKRYFEQAEADAQAQSSEPSTKASGNAYPSLGKANSTLFISRLPYSATSTDLETLFSDIGPLKRAFVVTDPQTKLSKGVGYVTFAIADDAVTALQQLQGKTLDGKRKIQIKFADEKAPLKERKAQRNAAAEGESAPSAKRPRTDAPAAAHQRPQPDSNEKDPDAVRTVILSGLSGCSSKADQKQIYKRARKIGDVEVVHYPHKASDSPDDVAHVVFRTPNHAMTAVEKLHAHTFKGVQISAVLKKRFDNAAKLAAHMRPETLQKREKIREAIEKQSGKGTALVTDAIDKSSRLIIRNLPFDVSEADLRAIFLPFGPIYSIDVPTTKVEVKVGKAAQKSASDAEKENDMEEDEDEDEDEEAAVEDEKSEAEAEEEVEGGSDAESTSGGDKSGEDVDEEEEDDDKEDEEAGTASEEQQAEADDEETEDAADSGAATQTVERGRGFAFVWHVSRNDAEKAMRAINGRAIRHGAAEHAVYKAAKGKKGRDAAKVALNAVRANAQPERVVAVDWALSKKDWEARAEQLENEASDDTKPEKEGDEDEEDDDDDDEDEDEEDDDDDDEDDDDEAPDSKPALPQPEEGTTLFIRNLPYQATEDELKSVFRHFGPLRYAKVTMDKASNRSKGTGFVCFWQASSADAALAQARLVETEASAGSTSTSSGKNPFSMPSVLTADPSAPLASALTLHGRVLNIVPAVARDEASKLEASGRSQREKADKRNTYLMREGVPLPDTELARALSESEREKRLHAFTIRRGQLGSNPALFISKTRLAVQQLPLFVSDKVLKKMALHAIHSFKDEVKAGTRTDLSVEEKTDKTASPVAESSKRPIKGPVVQAKIVRQADRIDPLTGQGRSRGYGFLELRSFADALRVLRWANANKSLSGLFAQWWREDLEQSAAALTKQIAAKRQAIASATRGTINEAEATAEVDGLDARVKRIRRHLDSGAKVEKAERGGLIVLEFSIENATVTRKRALRTQAMRDGAAKRKERDIDEERQRKKAESVVKAEKTKNKIGALVGKKRKMKKAARAK